MSALTVEASPHIRSSNTTQSVMRDVVIALLPTLVASVVIFGVNALILTLVCVISCVVFEYISRVIMKKPQTVGDLSAVVTGILLAYNLPASLPWYMAVIGSFVAIVIVKQLFGGLGQNFANPAIVGRIVLMFSFTSAMTKWTAPVRFAADATATATPLELIDLGEAVGIKELFFGVHSGTLGETCAFTLILGGIYLVIRKVISAGTPLAFIGTIAVCSFFAGDDPLVQILTSGVLLGAIFMATDYATTPVTFIGKVIFGIGCGLITFIIRYFSSSYTEGVSFAILLMNILTPYIDMIAKPKALGAKKAKKEEVKA